MPIGTVNPSGVTEIEVIVGAVIVRVMDCVMPLSAAVIDVVPAATPVTSPFTSTVAAAVLEEDHVTFEVRSRLLPSEYAPVAVSCCVVWTARVDTNGDIVMEVRPTLALFTASVADACVVPDLAVTLVTPVVTAVAMPPVLMVATPESEENQVTDDVRSWVLPSENRPVA